MEIAVSFLPGEVNNMDPPAKSVKFDPSNVCHYFATNKTITVRVSG